MNWVLLSIIVALLYAIVNLVDKIFIDNFVKNHYLATAVSSLSTVVFFCSASLIKANVFDISTRAIIIAVSAGIVNAITILLYYYTLKKIEVSRFVPILALNPVIVIFLSYFILNEFFSSIVYLGLALIAIGSILISLKKESFKIKISLTFILTFLTAFGFALKNVLVKLGSMHADIYAINFWLGVTAGFMFLIFIILGWPKTSLEKKNARNLFFIDIGSAITFFTLSIALAKGPATLVSSLYQLKIVFVFIISILLTLFIPKLIKEKITKKILIQKIISIALIIIGALLIT